MNLRSFFLGRAVVLFVVGLSIAGFFAFTSTQKQPSTLSDHRNAEYLIGGRRVRLGDDGEAATRYFGNEISVDLNSDDRNDVVFLVTHDGGGTGVFYYVVAALATENGYVGSEAFLVGDRIAPQTTVRGENGSIIVNYADRAPGEPFTTAPSFGKSLALSFDVQTMKFVEINPSASGELDPSKMTLGMKSWTWVSALYNDGREIIPNKPGDFVLTFEGDGRFAVKTDCNAMAGKYVTDGGAITFLEVISTKMFCEGSKEGDFASFLTTASGYHFSPQGRLILDLKFDSGSVVFK